MPTLTLSSPKGTPKNPTDRHEISRLGPALTDWQEEMASLLGTLTDQERKEISSILRDRIAALGRQVPGVAI